MGILQRLFGKKSSEATEHASTQPASPQSESLQLRLRHQIIQKANLWLNASLNATQKPRLSRLLPQRLLQVNQMTVNGLLKKSTKNAIHNIF